MGRPRSYTVCLICLRVDDDGGLRVRSLLTLLGLSAPGVANSVRPETPHPEMERHSPSSHDVNLTNAPQQHPSPRDRPPVDTHPSDFTAAFPNTGPNQTIGIPCDGQNQSSSVPDYRPLIDSQSPSDLTNVTPLEESGIHKATPPGIGSPSGTNSVCAGIMQELCHGGMASPVHHNPSKSQPKSMAQVQRHALAARNQGVVKRARQDPKVWCPQCNRGFHATKAVNRHWEDCHSERKNCDYRDCTFTYIGKRKLEAHLQKVHGVAPRRRAPRTQEVYVRDSQICSPPPQPIEPNPEPMSGLESFPPNSLGHESPVTSSLS